MELTTLSQATTGLVQPFVQVDTDAMVIVNVSTLCTGNYI